MLKKLLLFTLFSSPIIGISQEVDSAGIYFKSAVVAAKNGNKILADSLYTRSLEIKDHVNAYFNRGKLRSQKFDTTGYCTDMAFAAGLGDKEASVLFHKYCGTTTSSPLKKQEGVAHRSFDSHYQVIYQSKFMSDSLIARYRKNASFHSFCWMTDSKKTPAPIEDPAKKNSLTDQKNSEYPGGFSEMLKFVQSNVIYPAAAREGGMSGRVFTRFVINNLGYIENIEVLKGMANCRECDEEVVRLIAAMPRWKPAMQNGKAVKTYFNFPFSFKIN